MKKKKKIGSFEVHPIGIGTWCIGGGIHRKEGIIYADYDNEEKEISAIKYSIKQGQNHIDTAQMYGVGHTEEVVGQAIKGEDREKLFIASKLWKSHAQRSAVIPAVRRILNRLEIKKLNLLYMHTPSVPEPMEEYLGGMNDAVDNGLVDYLAVSNFNLEQLKKAVSISKHPIIANQMHYNLLHKQDISEEMMNYCLENEIMIVAYRPLERRLLADNCENEVVLQISEKYKKNPAQIALNWLVRQENVIAIPKAVLKKHIDMNLASLDFQLSEEDFKVLSEVADIQL